MNTQSNNTLLGDEPKLLIHFSELFAREEGDSRWLVENLLPKKGLSVLGAPPKMGKSTLARHLTRCLAKGEAFLGCFPCEKTPVVYIDMDAPEEELRVQLFDAGLVDEDPVYACSFLRISNFELMDALYEAAALGAKLIIIDTLQQALKVDDLNDYTKVHNALKPLADFSLSRDILIVVLHHTRKGGTGSDALLGSQALRALSTTTMFLESGRKSTDLKMFTSQRYGKPNFMFLKVEHETSHFEGRVVDEEEYHGQGGESLEGVVLDVLKDGQSWLIADLKKCLRKERKCVFKNDDFTDLITKLKEQGKILPAPGGGIVMFDMN